MKPVAKPDETTPSSLRSTRSIQFLRSRRPLAVFFASLLLGLPGVFALLALVALPSAVARESGPAQAAQTEHSAAAVAARPSAPPVTAVVDWTRVEGRINRTLFSTQGFMQIYVEPNHRVMDSFLLTNPADTQTRLETYIHKMEPENDNDDPEVFNWDKLYPERQIRFIDDREPFLDVVDALRMEPLALLCYNVDWLRSGDPDDIVSDHAEWAEFAAAVVESYNGPRGDDYRPRLRLVEVWNEPNFSDFTFGTKEAFSRFYNRVAQRIRREYPGVLVGGPCVTKAGADAGEWIDFFIKNSGRHADYLVYHTYGETPEAMVRDIVRWTDQFRRLPGKADAKLMITETDQWIQGWAKKQFIMNRQFRFLEIADRLLGIHHFCCLAYSPMGNYTFGLVDEDGAVLGGTFWPYWLFRNLIGEEVPSTAQGERGRDLDLVASRDRRDDGRTLASAVFHNRSDKALPVDTYLFFPAAPYDRVLALNRMTRDFQGIARVERIPAGQERHRLTLDLEPGEGLALVLQGSGRRFFDFRDLNNQEGPWIGLATDLEDLEVGDAATLTVHLLNTNFGPLSGELRLHGVPDVWSAELVEGDPRVERLEFGESRRWTFRVRADNPVARKAVAPYARFHLDGVPTTGDARAEVLLADGRRVRIQSAAKRGVFDSIPVSLAFASPLKVHALPRPVEALRGETNQVTVQITSRMPTDVEGRFRIELPEGLTALDATPATFEIPARERVRYHFPFRIASDIQTGMLEGTISLDALGMSLPVSFQVAVHDLPSPARAIPVDLASFANRDAVTFADNRSDYDMEAMGLFSFPADFTPSDRMFKVRGVPYQMLSLDDGLRNCVLPQGQRIDVPEGRYTSVAFLGFGHEGKHHGTWRFVYTDDATTEVDSQIPEWCLPPPGGPEGFHYALVAPYRHIVEGTGAPACQLFSWRLPVDSERVLRAIELPRFTHGYLFAITLLEE